MMDSCARHPKIIWTMRKLTTKSNMRPTIEKRLQDHIQIEEIIQRLLMFAYFVCKACKELILFNSAHLSELVIA